MFKKLVLSLLVALFATNYSSAQDAEFGLMVGGTYYIGDINPKKHFYNTQIAGAMLLRYNFNPRVALRANIMLGSVEAADTDSDVPAQKNRNLAFKSNLLEFGGLLEINFYEYRLGDFETPFTPYVFFGLSVFKFNPTAELKNNTIELQPLGTEGQGTSLSEQDKYNLTQLALPFGGGFKINLTPKIGLNIEYGFRKTFTDYLDDVSTTYVDPVALSKESSNLAAVMSDRSGNGHEVGSQRGNSPADDWYSFVGVGLTIRVGGKRSTCPTWN